MFNYDVTMTTLFPLAGINCTPPAIEDFPPDLFDEKQRQNGAVVVHVIISLYLFIALAVVCDKFFVPAVEKICHGKKSWLSLLLKLRKRVWREIRGKAVCAYLYEFRANSSLPISSFVRISGKLCLSIPGWIILNTVGMIS